MKHLIRPWLRDRRFAALVVAIMALGIGSTTAVFSVLHALVLRPLPFSKPDSLVMLWESNPTKGQTDITVRDANFLDWRLQSRSFEGLAAFTNWGPVLRSADGSERLIGARVSANLFPLLGVRTVLGRIFDDAEERPGAAPVLLLSHAYWQNRLGGDPNILGKTLRLNDREYQVIGVMPAGFRFPYPIYADAAQVWAPLTLNPQTASRRGHSLITVGRLKPGISVDAARSEMEIISRRLEAEYPRTNQGWHASVVRMSDEATGAVRPTIVAMFAAVGALLLVSCTNAAALFLSRSLARRKDMAIRLALGASRFRLAAELLAESIVLSLSGGALGILAGYCLVDPVTRYFISSLSIPRVESLGYDQAVLVFALLISILSGAASGLVSALKMDEFDLNTSLRIGALGGGVRGGKRIERVLVQAQFALATVLVLTSALLLKSLLRLDRAGFTVPPENLLTMRILLPNSEYGSVQAIAGFSDRLLEAVAAQPGIAAAGVISDLNSLIAEREVSVSHSGASEQNALIPVYSATPSYFAAVQASVLRGRGFESRDRTGTLRVAVVNEAMERQYWPGLSAVGKKIQLMLLKESFEIVGVIKDLPAYPLSRAATPAIYLPFAQRPSGRMYLVVNGAARLHPQVIANACRQLRAESPVLFPEEIRTMREIKSAATAHPRIRAVVIGVFSSLALLLAAAGLYALMSYSVSRRMREFGVRIALGCRAGELSAMVVREAFKSAIPGVSAGILAFLGISRVVSSLLFGIAAIDPAVIAIVAAAIVLTAVLAAYSPARRASRVDPCAVLRWE